MSLLNNMLNDIEKRRVIAGAGQALPEGGTLSQGPRIAFQRTMIPLILVAGVAGVGVWVWSQYYATRAVLLVPQAVAASRVPAVSPAPLKLAPAIDIQASPAALAAAAPAAPVVSRTISAPSVSPPDKGAIESLLAVAERKEASPAPVAVSSTASSTVSSTTAETKGTRGKTASRLLTSTMSGDAATVAAAAMPALSMPISAAAPTEAPAPVIKIVRPEQKSDNFYRQGLALLQQSRTPEAQQVLKKALVANANNHRARQLLAESLLDGSRNAEAAALLQDGLELAPGHPGFSMTLARLQATGGSGEEAISTLEQGLHNAGDEAEYHALLATLLQKQGRHADAVQHYVSALRTDPSMPNWLIGAGISLQAEDKMKDAEQAYQRAIDSGELSAEVAQFAAQQLKLIRQPQ